MRQELVQHVASMPVLSPEKSVPARRLSSEALDLAAYGNTQSLDQLWLNRGLQRP